MTVTFDHPLDSIEAYEGSQEACDGSTCTFTNEIWNGVQQTGNILSLGFQAPGDYPEVVTFAFNGETCEAPPATTEAPSESTTVGATETLTVGSTEAPTAGSTTEAADGDCPESEITQVWGSGMK